VVPVHLSVRAYTGLGRSIDRLASLIRDSLVPRLKQPSGFLGHCSFASEDGDLVFVTVSRDCPSGIQADSQIEEWMLATSSEVAVCKPSITAGETLLHEIASIQRDDDPAMFIVVRIYNDIGPIQEVLPLVREHVFLTITGAPGFRGYYAFLDEQDATRGVAVSLFDERGHAMEANERVVSVMRDRHIAPSPPAIMAGKTIVVAAA
jgi:hypothetical protein